MTLGLISFGSATLAEMKTGIEYIQLVSRTDGLKEVFDDILEKTILLETKEGEVASREQVISDKLVAAQKALDDAEKKEAQADAALIAAEEYEKAWEARIFDVGVREAAATQAEAALAKKTADFDGYVEDKKAEFAAQTAELVTQFDEVDKLRATYEEKMAALQAIVS